MQLPRFLFLLVACTFPACEFVGPSFGARHGVLTYLTVEPDRVAPVGEFTATLKIENTSVDTVEIYEGCVSPARLSVWGTTGSSFRVNPGKDLTCVGITVPTLLVPQDTLSWVWELQAGVVEEPAEPGTYKVRLDFHPNNHFRRLEHRFWVEERGPT